MNSKIKNTILSKKLKKYEILSNILKYIFIDICNINPKKYYIYNNQIRWKYDLTKEYNKLNSSKESDFSIEAFMKDPKVSFPNNQFSLDSLKKSKGFSKDKNNH
tara:strand:+ start:598 stop:909 length:312 start_codon:yes stop_codon:yes gene_type:complete